MSTASIDFTWQQLGPLTDAVLASLRAEASEAFRRREKRETPPGTVRQFADGSLMSAARSSTADPGPVLAGLLHDSALLAELRTVTAMPGLNPTRASYCFYGRDDYLGLHRDVRACGVTLLLELSDCLEPLTVGVDLASFSNDDLVRFATENGSLPSRTGVAAQVPRDRFAVLDGRKFPHWRTPHRCDRTGTVITLCFFDGFVTRTSGAVL
ncbi:MAG: hypothetical protein AAGC66_12055 [Leifsonia sp.]